VRGRVRGKGSKAGVLKKKKWNPAGAMRNTRLTQGPRKKVNKKVSRGSIFGAGKKGRTAKADS